MIRVSSIMILLLSSQAFPIPSLIFRTLLMWLLTCVRSMMPMVRKPHPTERTSAGCPLTTLISISGTTIRKQRQRVDRLQIGYLLIPVNTRQVCVSKNQTISPTTWSVWTFPGIWDLQRRHSSTASQNMKNKAKGTKQTSCSILNMVTNSFRVFLHSRVKLLTRNLKLSKYV